MGEVVNHSACPNGRKLDERISGRLGARGASAQHCILVKGSGCLLDPAREPAEPTSSLEGKEVERKGQSCPKDCDTMVQGDC